MPASPAQKTPQKSALTRAELFRLLADPARLELLALCAEEELSVGELAELLKDSQPQISRKVAPLREGSLLDVRRDGTRSFLRMSADRSDPVIAEALAEGRRLSMKSGSLARVPKIVAQREESGRALFDETAEQTQKDAIPSAAHMAHLAALSPLLPGRELAVDAGAGEGLLLDVLAPLYSRVIAVDRSRAQLARCGARVASRGFTNVSLFPGSYDDVALVQRVDAAGGADLVYASRALHHASRPQTAIGSFARLLKKGGYLVILDYLPHSDESMREAHGDVWQGFDANELASMISAAGLGVVSHSSLPPAFHREGPDAQLDWHVWVGRKPLSRSSTLSHLKE